MPRFATPNLKPRVKLSVSRLSAPPRPAAGSLRHTSGGGDREDNRRERSSEGADGHVPHELSPRIVLDALGLCVRFM
jgi:hypothetical protein